jgi:hexosaminidase
VAKMESLKPGAEQRILGIQGQLWGENIHTQADVEYFLLPRLVPLAERAWARDPGWHLLTDADERNARITREWNGLANRLGQRELMRLDGFLGGVRYRIPVPGAVVYGGMLHANICFPGFVLRYATDGNEPTSSSPIYQGPVQAEYARVAAFTQSGRRGRSVVASASHSA